MDENIASFSAITSADPEKAAQFLRLTDNNLEQAIALFFEGPSDLDLGGSNAAQTSSTLPAASTTRPRPNVGNIPDEEDIIQIDSDDEMEDSRPAATQARPAANVDDDEAMARRLQEEMYGGGGPGADQGFADVRAPMARTTETLVGGPDNWDDPAELNAAVAQQMLARRQQLAQRKFASPSEVSLKAYA